MFIDGTFRWEGTIESSKPSQTKISSAKIFHPKLVTKVTRARLESSLYFGIRSSEYQRHGVQFPWCTDAGALFIPLFPRSRARMHPEEHRRPASSAPDRIQHPCD